MVELSFNTAYTQLREMYGLIINPDEFETLGIIAWDKIGNRRVRLYHYQVVPSENELKEPYVELPCNAHIIEAVTADYEDYQKTDPMRSANQNYNGWQESYVESRKYNTGSLYPSGKFIKYRQEGNILYLSDKFNLVNILYKGILSDDEGLPKLNPKEIDAIATFCAYTKTYKDALVTRDQNLMQFAQLLKQEWNHKCTQARVPDYINQNELDEILNVSTSWDRKRFGKSYKPIR